MNSFLAADDKKDKTTSSLVPRLKKTMEVLWSL
jgi:hypothetical protein